jgi:hypothetical protein
MRTALPPWRPTPVKDTERFSVLCMARTSLSGGRRTPVSLGSIKERRAAITNQRLLRVETFALRHRAQHHPTISLQRNIVTHP